MKLNIVITFILCTVLSHVAFVRIPAVSRTRKAAGVLQHKRRLCCRMRGNAYLVEYTMH